MSTKEKARTIDWSTGLAARGLFALATEHYRKARECELAMIDMLGVDDGSGYGGCLSDEVYDENPSFDRGAKAVGLKIGTAPKKKRARP